MFRTDWQWPDSKVTVFGFICQSETRLSSLALFFCGAWRRPQNSVGTERGCEFPTVFCRVSYCFDFRLLSKDGQMGCGCGLVCGPRFGNSSFSFSVGSAFVKVAMFLWLSEEGLWDSFWLLWQCLFSSQDIATAECAHLVSQSLLTLDTNAPRGKLCSETVKIQTRSTGHWPWLPTGQILAGKVTESLISDRSDLGEEGFIMAHGLRDVMVGTVMASGVAWGHGSVT